MPKTNIFRFIINTLDRYIRFNSPLGRGLVVLFPLCILISFTYLFPTSTITAPSDLRFYTKEKGPHIMDRDGIQSDYIYIFENRRDQDHCLRRHTERKLYEKSVYAMINYRETFLCNETAETSSEWLQRVEAFKKRVDQLWFEYYARWAERIMLHFFYGMAIWLTLAAFLRIGIWINRGS